MSESASGVGMLAIWHDVAPGSETIVEHWYNSEHHVERLGIPGFLEAARYQSVDLGSRRYMCLYQTTTPAVLSSPEYLACVNNPTRQTQLVMPLYRNFSRTICRIALVNGHTHGEWIAIIALSLGPKNSASLLSDLFVNNSEMLLHHPGVSRCRWLERADNSPLSPATSLEATFRDQPDRSIDVAILVDVKLRHQAYQVLRSLETIIEGAAVAYQPMQRGCYQQVFSATQQETSSLSR